MENNEYVIKAEKLKKVYHLYAEEIVALKGIDVTIKKGEFVSIMGPSGAGKTTFLNLAGCLDNITSGHLNILGENVDTLNEFRQRNIRLHHVGFVFQEFFLVKELTALENIELPIIFADNEKNMDWAKHLLERVGLSKRMNHLPKELSGGEMQRVAIARSLANKPDIILADEPTGNLDTKNAQSIYDLFREIGKEENITIIAATHNVKLAYQADRIIHLREGNIEKDEVING
ncbi:ABC transporter ATP-binding protein [Candidatus Poribacteria bacterium]|nr:ABC transporter ATP-binding protein [Candidatus Poribacteria bacterium]